MEVLENRNLILPFRRTLLFTSIQIFVSLLEMFELIEVR
jgi:hypothetical protein